MPSPSLQTFGEREREAEQADARKIFPAKEGEMGREEEIAILSSSTLAWLINFIRVSHTINSVSEGEGESQGEGEGGRDGEVAVCSTDAQSSASTMRALLRALDQSSVPPPTPPLPSPPSPPAYLFDFSHPPPPPPPLREEGPSAVEQLCDLLEVNTVKRNVM